MRASSSLGTDLDGRSEPGGLRVLVAVRQDVSQTRHAVHVASEVNVVPRPAIGAVGVSRAVHVASEAGFSRVCNAHGKPRKTPRADT